MPALPKLPFDLPSLPSLETVASLPSLPAWPRADVPSIDEVTAVVRDAAYIGVGVAVVTAERVRDAAVAVARQLGDAVSTGAEQARRLVAN